MFVTLIVYVYIIKNHYSKVFPGKTDAEGMGLGLAGSFETVIYMTILGHLIGWW